jgi:tetratricopeptide (TPR) repeat protein
MIPTNLKLLNRAKNLMVNNNPSEEAISSILNDIQIVNSAKELTSLYSYVETPDTRLSHLLLERIVEKYCSLYELLPEEAIFLLKLETLLVEGPNELDITAGYLKKFKGNSIRSVKLEDNYDYYIEDKHIIALDLSRWEINEVPECIGSLSRLKYLNLNGLKLKELPETIEQLSQLEELNLNGNKLSIVQDVIIMLAKDHYVQKYIEEGVDTSEALVLGFLEILSGCSLEKVDIKDDVLNWESVFNYQVNETGHITGLFLSREKVALYTFPKQICTLKYLEELKITQASLESIPDSIKKLANLKKLDLSFNEIKSVPSSIKELKNLVMFSLDGNDISEKRLNSLTWNNIGRIFIENADYEGAIEECLETLKVYPKHEIAWYHLGLACEENGDFEKAENALNHVIGINSNNAAAWSKLADIFLIKSDYINAINAIKRVLNIEPDVALFWGNLGFIYKKIGKYNEAINAYRRSLNIEPKNSKTWAALASIYRETGELEKEKSAYDRSLDP